MTDVLTAHVQAMRAAFEGKPQQGFYDWLLKEGKLFNPREVGGLEGYSGEPSACFKCSQEVTLGDPKFEYVEGWAQRLDGSVADHAWNYLPERNAVVDTTWAVPAKAYLGVVIPRDYLLEFWGKTGYSAPHLAHYYVDRVKV